VKVDQEQILKFASAVAEIRWIKQIASSYRKQPCHRYELGTIDESSASRIVAHINDKRLNRIKLKAVRP
jgi:hypothetical protein